MPNDSSTSDPVGAGRCPVPVMRPRLPTADAIVGYLREIDGANVYANFGPLEERLRARLAAFVDCDPDRVVTFANATLAIAGLVSISDLAAWDVPSFTFPASAHAVLQAGKSLHIADIAADSLRISPASCRVGAGRIDVMPFGAGISPQALEADCPGLIIDAAASLGAENTSLRHIRPGDAVVFSLHATKVLGCGEAAFAVCGSAAQARRLRTWSNFGLFWSRDSEIVGTNAKLSEYAAAVAHAALDHWPEQALEWRRSQSLVRAAGAAFGLESLPPTPPEVSPYWIVMFDGPAQAEHVERVFAGLGIGTRRWWSRGLHRMPAFAALAAGDFPVTDWIAGRYLGLPVFLGITADEVAAIERGFELCGFRPGR